MKTIISLVLTILLMIFLIKLLRKADTGNTDVGGKIMRDIGKVAREIKEDFDKGFHEKDSVTIDSLKLDSLQRLQESEPH